jgi:hypothetical protein
LKVMLMPLAMPAILRTSDMLKVYVRCIAKVRGLDPPDPVPFPNAEKGLKAFPALA